MLPHNTENENYKINVQFTNAIKELQIGKLLKRSNIRKDSRSVAGGGDRERRTAFEIFQFLLLLVFQGRSLFGFLGSKKRDIACSKNTYYRFLNNGSHNWKKFLLLLACKAISYFSTLTRPERVKCLVMDDSVVARSRSKKVELLSWIFDHVIRKSVKGFCMLTLAWTDGYSIIPIAFNMLASRRLVLATPANMDKRTNGAKRRREAVLPKPEAAARMVREALEAGIKASYLLVDTWFTNEPFIKTMTGGDVGIDVIGMLKDVKQQYWYKGHLRNLKSLALLVRYSSTQNIFGSVCVETRYHKIPARIVFVRNRNKHGGYIPILSTDLVLSDAEIVRLYGRRWSIECCFKACKSLLKLGKEFQGISYDMTVSSTAVVFTRFVILEWLRRKENDQKTMCELFFVCCEDIQDLELEDSLSQLLSLFMEGIRSGDVAISESFRIQMVDWFVSQPRFIRHLFPMFLAELGDAECGLPICQAA